MGPARKEKTKHEEIHKSESSREGKEVHVGTRQNHFTSPKVPIQL